VLRAMDQNLIMWLGSFVITAGVARMIRPYKPDGLAGAL